MELKRKIELLETVLRGGNIVGNLIAHKMTAIEAVEMWERGFITRTEYDRFAILISGRSLI